MKHLLITALIAFLPIQVRAEVNNILTVGDYFEACNPSLDSEAVGDTRAMFQVGICIGFVNGLATLAHLNCELDRSDTPIFFKADLNGTELSARRQALWNFTRDNPNTWEDPSGYLIVAFGQNWPCN